METLWGFESPFRHQHLAHFPRININFWDTTGIPLRAIRKHQGEGMPHRISLAELKSQPVIDVPPGFCWHLDAAGGDPKQSLMLDSESADHRVWVWLSGENSFTTQYARNHSLAKRVALPVGGKDWAIELPEHAAMSDNRETLGALILCNEGAYLVIKNSTDDYSEFAYVSLQDLKMHDYPPSQQYGVFTTWRLTTSEANGSDRATLISQGDWP